ncbi:TPM domain-containing protein [Nitratifractor sp.]
MKQTLIALTLGAALMIASGCDSKATEENTTQAAKDRTDKIIIDDAYVLYDNEKLMKQYREFNDYLLQTYDIDFRVMTVSNEDDIDLYANKQFAELQQKSRSKSGKALLLVINTMQDKVRLEVSKALEPVYTDAFVSYIERKGFVPYFRDYKIADGVYMATELVKDRALEATEGKEFMPPMKSESIGGGAKTKSFIGVADPNAKAGAQVATHSSDTPMDVLKKYLKVLKSHNKNPNLDIYTDATRQFFANWTVTEINQDNEVRFLQPCMSGKKIKYSDDGIHAVAANEPYDDHRTCAPYFFKKENGAWKLDIATMAKVIRFNQPMQWHLNEEERYKGEAIYYAYAFAGYWFDKYGYPHSPKKEDLDPEWEKYRWQYACNGYYHPGDRKEDMKCLVRAVKPGGPANVRLGLNPGVKVYGFGEGESRKENATYKELIAYLNSVPSGEVATIIVEHYYLDGKETYDTGAILKPNVKVRKEIRYAVAP